MRGFSQLLVYLFNSDRRGVTGTHKGAVVLGKRHLVLRTNDNHDARCIASFCDVLVLIDVYSHRQTYTTSEHNRPLVRCTA